MPILSSLIKPQYFNSQKKKWKIVHNNKLLKEF